MSQHTNRLTSRLAVGGMGLLLMSALTGPVAQAATGASGASTPAPTQKSAPAKAPVTGKPPVHAPAKIKSASSPRGLIARPAVRASVASAALAPSTCTLVGTVRTCDLYARAGTITPPGATAAIPIWSFTQGATDPVVLPGAMLIANQGETLAINLHNQLPAADGQVSLEIPAVAGVQVAGASTYSFNLTKPGTYIYEAAASAHGARQVAMGLSGMLVVRPSVNPTTTDLGDPATAFTAEAAVQVQEVDPVFNNAPLSTDLSVFNPQFFLVNGHAYGDVTRLNISVNPSDRLLLRYANLGLSDREISLLNQRQMLVEQDSNRLTNPVENDVEFLTAGGASSTITQIDPTLVQGDTIALYDQGRHLFNGTTDPGLAGMMGLISVNAPPGGTVAGPTTQVSVSPSTYDASPASTPQPAFAANVTATFSPAATGQEWFLDQIGADGTGHPFTTNAGCTATFCLTFADILGALPAGDPVDGEHVIWVHGTNANGWGYPSGDMITINGSGPVAVHVQLHRPRTNGTTAPNDLDGTNDVGIVATAAAALPGWVVTDAQYCVDYPSCAINGSLIVNPTAAPCTNHYTSTGASTFTATAATDPAAAWTTDQWVGYTVGVGGSTGTVVTNSATTLTVVSWTPAQPADGTAFTVQVSAGAADSPTSVCGWIPAGLLSTLSQGSHTVSVRVQQSNGTNSSWGSFAQPTASATLVYDTQGPLVATSPAPTVLPNPNNGFQASTGNIGWLDSLQVQATFDDSGTGNSPIVLAESFLGGAVPPASANGAGAEMVPIGGQWSVNPTQQAYAYLPLADIRAMSDGIVPIYVHAQDAAGNWGPFTTIDLTLDKTAPTAPGGCTAPATTCGPTVAIANGATTKQRVLTISATDPTVNGVSTGVNGAEIFTGGDPGAGNGHAVPGTTSPFTVTVSWGTAVAGTVYLGPTKPATIFARARDVAGNWSPVTAVAVP